MKLTEAAKELIGGKTPEAKVLRSSLALALNFTDQWVGLSARLNKDNGPLTTFKAIQTIKQHTGLNEQEILKESPSEVRA